MEADDGPFCVKLAGNIATSGRTRHAGGSRHDVLVPLDQMTLDGKVRPGFNLWEACAQLQLGLTKTMINNARQLSRSLVGIYH